MQKYPGNGDSGYPGFTFPLSQGHQFEPVSLRSREVRLGRDGSCALCRSLISSFRHDSLHLYPIPAPQTVIANTNPRDRRHSCHANQNEPATSVPTIQFSIRHLKLDPGRIHTSADFKLAPISPNNFAQKVGFFFEPLHSVTVTFSNRAQRLGR